MTHPEFEGRAIVGPSFVTGKPVELKTLVSDGHGHGTHCAGTIAGKTFGVAPKATVIGLQAFGADGIGSAASTIAALQYAVRNRNVILFNLRDP